MVNPHTLVIGLISRSNLQAEAAVLENMRKLGARVLVLGTQLENVAADYKIEFPVGLDEVCLLPLYLPLIQLLAFHRSLAKGLNPDQPTNLSAVVFL